MSDYTPSLLVGQNYYVTGRAQIKGEHAQDITPYSAEFNRMIDAVRAEEREQATREPGDAEVEAAAKAMREQSPANMPIWDDWVWARFTRAALLAAQGVRNG